MTTDDDFALLFQEIKEREHSNMLHSVQCIFFLAALAIAQSASSKGKKMIFNFLGISVALVPGRENMQVGLVRCMMWLLGSATVYSFFFFLMEVDGYSIKAN